MADYPWFKSYDPGVPHSLEPYPQHTAVDLLDNVVKLNPAHPMLIYQHKRLSWKTVNELSDKMAATLVANGIKKGDRVAVLSLYQHPPDFHYLLRYLECRRYSSAVEPPLYPGQTGEFTERRWG